MVIDEIVFSICVVLCQQNLLTQMIIHYIVSNRNRMHKTMQNCLKSNFAIDVKLWDIRHNYFIKNCDIYYVWNEFRNEAKWYVELDRFAYQLSGDRQETITRQDRQTTSAWRSHVSILYCTCAQYLNPFGYGRFLDTYFKVL